MGKTNTMYLHNSGKYLERENNKTGGKISWEEEIETVSGKNGS
jgi:hypothetical protein